MNSKAANGLRGIAAFNVMLCHFVAAFLPMMLHGSYPGNFPENKAPALIFEILTWPLLAIFYNGQLAVILFFVLSGYVLSMPYFDASANWERILKRRIWGRYLRLNIPIIAAIFISYLFYRCGLYLYREAGAYSGSQWLVNIIPPNVQFVPVLKEAIFAAVLWGKGTMLPPLWTLGIEFMGSLYLLLFYITKPRTRIMLPMLLVFLPIYCLHGRDSIYIYAIFLGSLLNLFKGSTRYNFGLFLFGIYLSGFQFGSVLYDFLPTIKIAGFEVWERRNFYTLIGALCLTASIIRGAFASFFEHRVLQFLGNISFPLYLLNPIVLCGVTSAAYLGFAHGGVLILYHLAFYTAVCLIAATIFGYLVDRPAISISHRFSSNLFSENSTRPSPI